jgi:hypothetical protein
VRTPVDSAHCVAWCRWRTETTGRPGLMRSLRLPLDGDQELRRPHEQHPVGEVRSRQAGVAHLVRREQLELGSGLHNAHAALLPREINPAVGGDGRRGEAADEIERLLCAAAGVTEAANTPTAIRPRLGGISFLHRFGSALNRHVHLHACVTDGVFVPATDGAGGDAPPAFLPTRSITQADLATLTGRGRKSARPGANGVVQFSPFGFLDRLADLVPPPRKHRHRYHRVFAPNHKLRRAVAALAIANIGKQREAAIGGNGGNTRAAEGCYDTQAKPRSHDTSRIAWAKLIARLGEEFPLECPACGGDIRLIAFFTEP